jgi:hypothetical protein
MLHTITMMYIRVCIHAFLLRMLIYIWQVCSCQKQCEAKYTQCVTLARRRPHSPNTFTHVLYAPHDHHSVYVCGDARCLVRCACLCVSRVSVCENRVREKSDCEWCFEQGVNARTRHTLMMHMIISMHIVCRCVWVIIVLSGIVKFVSEDVQVQEQYMR